MARLMVRANTKKTHVMMKFNNVQNIDIIRCISECEREGLSIRSFQEKENIHIDLL